MSSEQLPLPVAPAVEEPPLRLPDRVVPMQATQVDAPFDDRHPGLTDRPAVHADQDQRGVIRAKISQFRRQIEQVEIADGDRHPGAHFRAIAQTWYGNVGSLYKLWSRRR